jgi:hypothetical protein
MTPRKKKPAVEYELLAVALSGYKARVDAAVNNEARHKRYHHADPKYERILGKVLLGVDDMNLEQAWAGLAWLGLAWLGLAWHYKEYQGEQSITSPS